jgi:uncharacterized membrane protein
MMAAEKHANARESASAHAFRRAVFRGLGVLFPPLATVLIFIWAGSTINQYVLRPVTASAREALVWAVGDIRTDVTPAGPGLRTGYILHRPYYRLDDEKYVPLSVYELVKKDPGEEGLPQTSQGVYRRYVELRFLPSYYVLPFILLIFTLLLYLLGKFMAAGIGRFFWSVFERGIIDRVPLVRNVYSGVKQVTDFMFNERDFEFTRVVAVEYPRKGIWSIGFVTSESFLELRAAANEPVLAVYIPFSPLPLTGCTVNCLRSECIDLNMTFDQACQYLISCGVIVPPHQIPHVGHAEGEAQPNHAVATTAGKMEIAGERYSASG